MERRGFLKSLIGGVAVAAAAQTFPFRVFSFPSQIKIAPANALEDPLNGKWISYKFNYVVTPRPSAGSQFRWIQDADPVAKQLCFKYDGYSTVVRGREAFLVQDLDMAV